MEAAPDNGRRALVLHDRALVVDLIELTLNHGLFVVRAAATMAEAEAILAEWRPHLAVVDMDHDDSAALLQRLGASNTLTKSVVPVLGLTRRGDLKTKLRAFELGVDDILTVPFSPEELLARTIVIGRRAIGTDRPSSPRSRSARCEIDILNREVRAGNSVVHLSAIEQSLLYLLASRAGQIVTREEILDAIWGTDFVAESNIVDRHVREPPRSSSRTTTAGRASSPRSRDGAIASSPCSRTAAGTSTGPGSAPPQADPERGSIKRGPWSGAR